MSLYPNNPMYGFSPYLTQIPVQQPVIPNYQPMQVPGPHMEVVRINGGRKSAEEFAMGPNSSAILVDNVKPKIWLVQTDASGYRMINDFWIYPANGEEEMPVIGKVTEETPVKAAEAGTDDPIKALNERLDKLEERMNRYGKPDHRASWQGKSGNANGQGIGGNDAARSAGAAGPDAGAAANGGQ